MTNDRFDPYADDAKAFDAQERALRQGDDTRWTQVAQALQQPRIAPLPSNFAFHVAQLARQQQVAAASTARSVAQPDTRLEHWLVTALGVAMAVAALVTTAMYGATWFSGTAHAVAAGFDGRAWVGVLLACLALHAACMAASRLARRAERRTAP